MKISNPKQLLSKFDKETYEAIQAKFGKIDRFFTPGDTFKFACDKRGNCCRNRDENPILLSVYDVFKLRQHLGVSGREFAEKYGQTLLGGQSDIPIMILRNIWIENEEDRSHCVFLKGNECSVYKSRPHVCRMYPVGRATDPESNSYFFLTNTDGCCQSGCGKVHTIESWLKTSKVEPYVEWNDKFNKLYMRINHKKYKALDDKYKFVFGSILYDIGSPLEKIASKDEYKKMSRLEDDSLLECIYFLATQYVEMVLK